MSARIRIAALALLVTYFSFVGLSFAAGAASPDDGSLLDYARPVFDAVMHGQYWAGASLAVVFACALARKYVPASYKTGIKGDLTGMALAFGMAAFGALATGLLAMGTNALTAGLAFTALKVGAVAIGGYTILHKLGTALVATAWFQSKAPLWLKVVATYALSAFGSTAIAKAEAAGAAAVKAAPSTGAAPGTFEQF